MIIDLSCYPTKTVDTAWRHDGDPFTGERLLKMMDGPYSVNGKPRRIDKAFIQPPQGNTIYNWTDGNRTGRDAIRHYMAYTVELTQRHPERFIGCFVYNPRCGIDNGVAELERHVKEHGFKMVQLHANMHAYRPDRAKDWIRPALKKCADLGLLVKLHTGDGPYSIPTEWVPIIKEFRSVDFIMAHFGVQTGGVYCFEPFQWATTSTASRAGACSRASSSSRRTCRSTRFSSARTRRRTSRGCGSACSRCCAWSRRRA